MKFDDYERTHLITYKKFAGVVRSLLKGTIAKSEGLPRLQSTKARAKDVKSLKFKLEERGLLGSEHIENEIKDLAGVRLIFYTNTDVDRFLSSNLIRNTFDVDWKETRIHHPTEENNQQRYQAIHYTVSLSEMCSALPKYKKFKGMRCEIQIQTILNHAWAETYHDIVYKARDGQGFGTVAKQALDNRMKKIMDNYLRPAGYEFQKVQHDYERLMQGKALFDRGAIETLESCNNNNERHAILSTIAEHVIPNYDDIGSVYQEIRRALETAVHAAKNTETKPIETPFGDIPGKTSKDVTLAALAIFNTLRYINSEATFQSLIDMYQEEQDEEVRKQIIKTVKHLAKYNLNVWSQVGPYVQRVLANAILRFSQDDLRQLRPLVLVVWRELLDLEMESISFSADSVTINSRAIPVFDGIKALRITAIDGLFTLFDASVIIGEKREVISALQVATRLPGRSRDSDELHQLILEDTKRVMELLSQRAAGQPYELLEHLEQDMLFDYQNARKLVADEHDKLGCQDIAKKVMGAIVIFRDLLNADQQYIRYKTLVGFESIFPPQWESEKIDFKAIDEYRRNQAALFVEEVSDETEDDWYSLIERCAATKSHDMATFPFFHAFLHQLSKVKPNIVFRFVHRNNPNLLVFLPAILQGLYESEAREKYIDLINDLLSRNAYLAEIARHCRLVKKEAADIISEVLHKAITVDDVFAVFECLIFAIQNHDAQVLPLVDTIFVPAINYLISKRDARWVLHAGYLPECSNFFSEVPTEYAGLVLENLLALDRLDYHTELILAPIAINQPTSVWEFFERRIGDERGKEYHYEAFPYRLNMLNQQLAKDADLAISMLQKWYAIGDITVRFKGVLLLQAVFPTFTDALESSISKLIASGSDEDYGFIIYLLENYHSPTNPHELIKGIIDHLPENDPRLVSLDRSLSFTGVITGEFGMVEALRKNKEAIALWKSDNRPKVRAFATAYVRRTEQQIASEQRSAEQNRALRLREYEVEGN